MLRWLFCIILFTLPFQVNAAQDKIALVIGNANYQHYSPLANPLNDAHDLADDLGGLGFDVMLGVDVTLDTTIDLIEQFGNRLRNSNAVGLFYYAGHAIQVDGENYLVPIDAKLEKPSRVPVETYRISMVLQAMRERAVGAINLIILDSCRNNPFPARTRGTSRGMARVVAPESSLILYATQPGETASDNSQGRNGLFTKHLRQAIQRPGIDVELSFSEVVRAVYRESNGRQYPWKEGVLLNGFIFKQDSPVTYDNTGPSSSLPASPDQISINDSDQTDCNTELAASRPLECLFNKPSKNYSSTLSTISVDCPSPLTNQSAIQCLFNQ